MSATQAQLQSVMKFSFGAATHRIDRYKCTSTLERTGVGHTAFRRFTYTIESELHGSDLADLKAQLDSAKTNLIKSGSDFKIYRLNQVIHQHDAAACHFGPTIHFDANGVQQSGTLESTTITVECLVPVSTAGGLIDHVYTDQSSVDDEGDTVTVVRTGRVTTTAAQSAAAWINANLTAQPAGYDRTVEISADDTDSEATYSVRDVKTARRNYDANVRDHKWSKTTTTRRGVLETIAWSGTVRMAEGQSARTYIEANLPATTEGYAREHSVSSSDDDRDGTYSVTDSRATWSGIPGIEAAQLEESRSVDTHLRVTLERRGYFIGANALTEIAAVRAALAVLGTIVQEEIRQDRYNDERYSFRFTALSSDDANPPTPATGIVFWQENVRRSGGKRPAMVSVYPDRNPFLYFGAPQPIVITIAGRLVTVGGAYFNAPTAPTSIAIYQSGETDEMRNRISERELETSWVMTFICPPGTAAPSPRDRSAVLP